MFRKSYRTLGIQEMWQTEQKLEEAKQQASIYLQEGHKQAYKAEVRQVKILEKILKTGYKQLREA